MEVVGEKVLKISLEVMEFFYPEKVLFVFVQNIDFLKKKYGQHKSKTLSVQLDT